MDVEKFVSDMNTGEELGRQVDRGLSRIDTMLTMIENRMAYGDWLADEQSQSGWLIGDEVVPVVADDSLPRGVVLALTPAQWALWRRGRITVGEFRRKWAECGVSDHESKKKTG
jgi:hypothetical protein